MVGELVKEVCLPNGLKIMEHRAGETRFLYREIFVEETYNPPGITIGPGDVVLDVGANIGLASVYFSHECGARVYAFEPVPDLFKILNENFQRFSVSGKTLEVGISDRSGKRSITYFPRLSGHSGFYPDLAAEEAPLRRMFEEDLPEEDIEKMVAALCRAEVKECTIWTLSQALGELGIEHVDLLKIDVEGSELDVLKGIQDHDWGKISQIVAEVHDVDGRVDASRSLLESHGFQVSTEKPAILAGSNGYMVIASRQLGSSG